MPARPGARAVLVLLPIRSIRWRVQGPWRRRRYAATLPTFGALPVRPGARHPRAPRYASRSTVTRAAKLSAFLASRLRRLTHDRCAPRRLPVRTHVRAQQCHLSLGVDLCVSVDSRRRAPVWGARFLVRGSVPALSAGARSPGAHPTGLSSARGGNPAGGGSRVFRDFRPRALRPGSIYGIAIRVPGTGSGLSMRNY